MSCSVVAVNVPDVALVTFSWMVKRKNRPPALVWLLVQRPFPALSTVIVPGAVTLPLRLHPLLEAWPSPLQKPLANGASAGGGVAGVGNKRVTAESEQRN